MDIRRREEEVATGQGIYVVEGLEKPLLGRPAIEALGLLKRVCEMKDAVCAKSRFANCFKPLDNLKGEITTE